MGFSVSWFSSTPAGIGLTNTMPSLPLRGEAVRFINNENMSKLSDFFPQASDQILDIYFQCTIQKQVIRSF